MQDPTQTSNTAPDKRRPVASMFFGRLSPTVRHRLWFLILGNLALLGFIYVCTTAHEKSSFVDELARIPVYLSPVILAGLGLTGVVFAAGIDLSIAAIIVVAGTVFAILFHNEAAPWVCFTGCFLTAVALSTWNGFLVRTLRISPIIVTLAGLQFYRGVALILADWCIPGVGGSLSIQNDAYHTPAKEYAGWILGVTLLAALLWEKYGRTPRTFLALGCSREACRIQGLNPGRILQSAYFVSGLFLGLGAVVYVTNRQVIEPARMARGFELDVIGAVVLGGTNIFGGEGTLAGTALGALFLYLIDQSMLYAGVSEFWRTAVQGLLIVAVIGFDCALHRRQKLLDELR